MGAPSKVGFHWRSMKRVSARTAQSMRVESPHEVCETIRMDGHVCAWRPKAWPLERNLEKKNYGNVAGERSERASELRLLP